METILPVLTDQDLIESWLASQRSDHTRGAYAADIAKALLFLQDKPLADITLRDLQKFEAHLQRAPNKHGKPYAGKTKQRFIIALKSLFAFASDEGHITSNPARKLNIPACKDDRGARVLTDEDMDKLMAAAKKRRDLLLFKTLFFSGARVSEIVGLRWKDVQPNPHGGQLALFGKGAKNRTVGIPGDLYGDLLAYRADIDGASNSQVFPSQKGDGGLSRFQIYRLVKAAARRAGINFDTSTHWLRHTYATLALEGGASLLLVSRDLGHTDIKTTEIYTHLKPHESASSYLKVKA